MNNEHTNEMDHEANGEGRMYDLLCRYVFGEATEAERMEVEAALAGSEELRAQKTELDATVALVQGAFSGSDGEVSSGEASSAGSAALSAVQMEELQAAAREASTAPTDFQLQPVKRRPRPWYASPAVQFAAAATVLLSFGAFYAYREAPGRGNAPMASSDESVAQDVALLELREDSRSARSRDSFHEVAASKDKAESGVMEKAMAEGSLILEAATTPSPELAQPSRQRKQAKGKVDSDRKIETLGYGEAPETIYVGRTGANAGLSVVDLEGFEGAVLTESRRSTGVGDIASTTIDGGSAGSAQWNGQVQLELKGAELPPLPGGGGAGGGPSPNGTPGPSGPARSGAPASLGVPRISMKPAADPGASSDVGAFFDDSSDGAFRALVHLYEGTGRAQTFGTPASRAAQSAVTRVPEERPRDMFFRFWGDNPFVVTRNDALSTFAADVDTASFTLARRMLRQGILPQRDQIRTEEFINFAKPDLAAPTEDTFAVHGELAPSPFGGREDRWLLRVGVRAKDVAREERPPLALTFVVDTSGSMRTDNRLELVKHSLRLLVNQLDDRDTLAIVGFSNEAREILPPTTASASDTIETALFGLQPDGGTNAEAGLKLGYALSLGGSAPANAQKRVIFLSDGVANIGQTDQDRLATEISEYASQGVFLNTIGVGMSNHNDVFLEQLADKGQGVCDYVADAADARRAIVERFVSGFVTVAKDLKIQVEFDGEAVLRWRQLGYENRAVADRDFRNDAVDAGEVGAGHQVTCYYELELASNVDDAAAALAKVRLRWKPIDPIVLGARTTETRETETTFRYESVVAPSFRAASAGFRLGALSAQLAECLRQSFHARGDSMDRLASGFANLLTDAPSEDVASMAEAVKLARDLGLLAPPPVRPTDADGAQQEAYYKFLIESLGGAEPVVHTTETVTETATEGAATGSRAPSTAEEYESRIRQLLKRDQEEDPH